MARIFWMAVGAGAAVWAMNKANGAVQKLTPDSLSGTAARGALHLGDLAKQFAQDVKAGMAEREEQLKDDLGLHGTAVVEPRQRRVLRGEPQYRAISAAPGSPAAALPPARSARTTPRTTEETPRRALPQRGGTPNRKDQ
ncbi:hypothetical protein GCM10018790_33190 [Kitasatospora xanthocidica]|uniref:DUF6167 family protein n=1 Tax=Kitasatospora xanthocidica TaxID=83382 RepID=UPI00167AA176|nr:DUF6167 family protein [Kitasatospora xanthocidica]GHF52799.1 hypothetical protein GCM10018790_33190 [Kitasatospora xanthocidica]